MNSLGMIEGTPEISAHHTGLVENMPIRPQLIHTPFVPCWPMSPGYMLQP